MMRLRMLVLLLLVSGVVPMAAQQQPPPEFVPLKDVPQAEQIPAMPLLGAAYGFIWVGVLGYVWSLGRRLQKVEAEISALERRSK